MPTRLLPVEHHIQEVGAGCLAACAQMVLRYIGLERSQRHLNRLLGLTAIGVPYSNVTRLARLGLQVTMLSSKLSKNDPAFAIAPQVIIWDEFLLAWGEMNYACALITRE